MIQATRKVADAARDAARDGALGPALIHSRRGRPHVWPSLNTAVGADPRVGPPKEEDMIQATRKVADAARNGALAQP